MPKSELRKWSERNLVISIGLVLTLIDLVNRSMSGIIVWVVFLRGKLNIPFRESR